MKSQISFIAMGLVVSTTALGFATVGPLPASRPNETPQVRIVDTAVTANPPRIYCYNGTKGEPGSLFRGWVCQSESSTEVTN